MPHERAAIPLNPRTPIRWGLFSAGDRDILDIEFRDLYAREELGLKGRARVGYMFGAVMDDFDDLANVFGLRIVNVYEPEDSVSAKRHIAVRLPLILRHLTHPEVRQRVQALRGDFLQTGVETEETYLSMKDSYWGVRGEISALVRANAALRGQRELFIALRFSQDERYAAFVDRRISTLGLRQ